jgi:choline monooxygenase
MADLLPFTESELAPQAPSHATSLPASCYAWPGVARLDRAAIFDRAWHLVAHVSQLAAAGDHVVADLAGLPVVAVRDVDGSIRVLHNVCRHRGGPLASCDGRGARALRCRYHGWTYGLDGVLKSAPEMSAAADFDLASIRLPRLEVRVWQGLVFAGSAQAPDFDALVAGMAARVGEERGLADYGLHQRVDYEIACNWKVYVDNFLEGYHLPHVHPALNRLLDYRSYATETADWHSLQSSPLDSDDALYGEGEALYYWLWPNTMLNLLPGRLQTNRVLPLGADRCRVRFDFHYRHDADAAARVRQDADRAFSDAVQQEDIVVCEDVQRGMASGSYVPGRLNPLRETGLHHFHELVRAAYRSHIARQAQPG